MTLEPEQDLAQRREQNLEKNLVQNLSESGLSGQDRSVPDMPAPDTSARDSVDIALNRLNNREKRAQAKAAMTAGQALFERGRYKRAIAQFQTALELSNPMGAQGGEIQLWLVNAHIAAGNQEEGLARCRKLIVHPDLETKRQGKRLLYILEAPELERRPEWVTQIPDLGNLEDDTLKRYSQRPKKPRRRKPKPEPEPIDLSLVETADNQFVWVALGFIILTLGGLIWFSS